MPKPQSALALESTGEGTRARSEEDPGCQQDGELTGALTALGELIAIAEVAQPQGYEVSSDKVTRVRGLFVTVETGILAEQRSHVGERAFDDIHQPRGEDGGLGPVEGLVGSSPGPGLLRQTFWEQLATPHRRFVNMFRSSEVRQEAAAVLARAG